MMKTLAFLPFAIVPSSFSTPIAYAELIVEALMACSGVRPIRMHARETTKFILPEGVDPGL